MRLTRHERIIVSRINKGEIYDIPSYLRSFGKGCNRAYDMDAIRDNFAADENGRQYKVLKDGHSLFISTHSTQHIMGQPIHTPLLIPRTESDIADDEWTLCAARLEDRIPPSVFTYDEKEYKVDFQQGAFVADNFQDILTFIRLWSYLRHENLVFEVTKPISLDEISMLYESVPCSKKRSSAKIKIEWGNRPSEDDGIKRFKPVTDIHQTVPTRRAEEFMDTKWKMNEDHLMMCHEFIGKKMYSTGALRNFAANNYRTSEEMHRSLNTITAVAALLISVLSFSYGLFYPSNTYQPALDNLTYQISQIQTALETISTNQLSTDEVNQIFGKLEAIEDSLKEVEASGVLSEIGELATDIYEIRDILSEYFPSTESQE